MHRVTFDNLLVERDGSVVVLTLNRPAVRNAIDKALLRRLGEVVVELEHDDEARAVVITGAGDRAFAAGADIRELSVLSGDEGRQHAALGQQVFTSIEQLDKPVIAAINGFALGGGCELAMACTLRVAGDGAVLGLPEVSLGLTPGFGATQRLPHLVGFSRARDLLLTGRTVPAAEALAIGLVDRVVPASDLLATSLALARELAEKAPLAVRAVLQAVRAAATMPVEQGQQLEAALFGLLAASEDAREGTSAFLEKRRARFQGR
jgi:enoyl-CoA hydratase